MELHEDFVLSDSSLTKYLFHRFHQANEMIHSSWNCCVSFFASHSIKTVFQLRECKCITLVFVEESIRSDTYPNYNHVQTLKKKSRGGCWNNPRSVHAIQHAGSVF